MNARAILLLWHLAALVAALAILLFQYPYADSYEMMKRLDRIAISFSVITMLLYFGLIFVIARNLLSLSLGISAYNEPKNINKLIEEGHLDMEVIKFFEADLLQSRIDLNIQIQDNFSKNLKKCISTTFIIPLVVLTLVSTIEFFTPVLKLISRFLYHGLWV